MVGGQAARIGGELLYDYRETSWVLSNKSGRYGLEGRAEHLENVRDLLGDFGINVQVHYLER